MFGGPEKTPNLGLSPHFNILKMHTTLVVSGNMALVPWRKTFFSAAGGGQSIFLMPLSDTNKIYCRGGRSAKRQFFLAWLQCKQFCFAVVHEVQILAAVQHPTMLLVATRGFF